jgi:predicted metal-dependent hydrolase
MTLEFSRIEINKLVRVKRRTIALIIERDGSLTIRAPRRVSLMEIESFVHEKTDWIIRTREKIKTIVDVPPKKYVDGDIFLHFWERNICFTWSLRNARP